MSLKLTFIINHPLKGGITAACEEAGGTLAYVATVATAGIQNSPHTGYHTP